MTFYTHTQKCGMIRYSKLNLCSIQKEMQPTENARLLVNYNCSVCWPCFVHNVCDHHLTEHFYYVSLDMHPIYVEF